MLNWQMLKTDLPRQVANLCNHCLELSSLLDTYEKREDFFSSTIMLRSLLSSFERVRQYLKTIVFTKATKLETIKVPLVEYPIEEEEEKKMIALPVKKYMERFEEDLKQYYLDIKKIFEESHIDASQKAYFFFDLRSFEIYIYDTIKLSKEVFYSRIKAYPYELRQEIKEKTIQVIEWKLEQLNEIAKHILEKGIQEKHYPKLVSSFILTLNSISKTKEIMKITIKKIKEKYNSIWLLVSNIKNKQIKIDNSLNTDFLILKINIANKPPFNDFFNNLLKEEISHAFNFPKPEDENLFWDIFLSSIIQRAGLIPMLKEKAKQVGGKPEMMVE